MAKELKNLQVKFISLVEAGANKREVVWKSDGQVYIPIKKIDEEQRLVYGVVYAPDDVDTQGDYATRDTIKQAAYEFMKAASTGNVDRDHDFNPDEGFIAESWLIKDEGPDPLFPDEKPGTWCVGIYVVDDNTWDDVKKGKLTGLSLAGVAERKEAMKDLEKRINEFIKKGMVRDNNDRGKLWNLVYALEDAQYYVLTSDLLEEEKKAKLAENAQEFIAILSDIKETGGDDSKDLSTLAAVYESLKPVIESLTKSEDPKPEPEPEPDPVDTLKSDLVSQIEALKTSLDEKETALKEALISKEDVTGLIDEKLADIIARVEKLEKQPLGKGSADPDNNEPKKRNLFL